MTEYRTATAAEANISDFIGSLGFLIGFLVLTLLIGMFFGSKPLFWFLILILASMVVMNQSKFSALFSKVAG